MFETGQNGPVISVFTLTFNQELFIGECIESVMAQKYADWEMIIVDDGSTDNTWNIIQSYIMRDVRVRAYRRENKGLLAMAEAYNLMLSQSTGAVIAILDGDDLWPPDKLSRQIVYHFDQGFDFTFGVCGAINDIGEKTSGVFPSKATKAHIAVIENTGSFASEYLRGSFPIFAVTCMINRSVLIKSGGFVQPSYLITTDYPTWVSALANGARAHFIDVELGFWRIQVGQTTWKRAREMALGTLRYAQEFAGNVPEHLVMSTGRQNFISDSLYRHAIFSLNHRDLSGIIVAMRELVRFRGHRSMVRFGTAVCFRVARKVLATLFKKG